MWWYKVQCHFLSDYYHLRLQLHKKSEMFRKRVRQWFVHCYYWPQLHVNSWTLQFRKWCALGFVFNIIYLGTKHFEGRIMSADIKKKKVYFIFPLPSLYQALVQLYLRHLGSGKIIRFTRWKPPSIKVGLPSTPCGDSSCHSPSTAPEPSVSNNHSPSGFLWQSPPLLPGTGCTRWFRWFNSPGQAASQVVWQLFRSL